MRSALLLTGLLAAVAAAQPPAKFVSAAGKFSASFPGKPSESKKPIRPGGDLTVQITQFEDADGGRLVLWNDITAKGYDRPRCWTGPPRASPSRARR